MTTPCADHDNLMTLKEAADYLRVSPHTVRRWAKSGMLPKYNIKGIEAEKGIQSVRFRRSEVEQLIALAP